jgi:hypothetical protein
MGSGSLRIEVTLIAALCRALRPRPRRTLLIDPGHTFTQLASAINAALAREDDHGFCFALPGGREAVAPWLLLGRGQDNADRLRVADGLGPGDSFGYLFDLGDQWKYGGRVRRAAAPAPRGAPMLLAATHHAPEHYLDDSGLWRTAREMAITDDGRLVASPRLRAAAAAPASARRPPRRSRSRTRARRRAGQARGPASAAA